MSHLNVTPNVTPKTSLTVWLSILNLPSVTHVTPKTKKIILRSNFYENYCVTCDTVTFITHKKRRSLLQKRLF